MVQAAMPSADAPSVPLRERLSLRSAATFSDDLGSFGESVPPRPRSDDGEPKRAKEDYCLRRLIIAHHVTGQLLFPMTVLSAKQEHKLVPDFLFRWEDADDQGVEVTEANDETYQEHLTDVARAYDRRLQEGFQGGPELEEVSFQEGAAAERQTADQIARAIRKKLAKLNRGHYVATPYCDLLVFDNTEFGGFLASRDLAALVRSDVDAGIWPAGKVHLLHRSGIVLDLLGSEPNWLDLSTFYDADLSGWALEQARLARDGSAGALDLANIAEELEYLAKSKRRARDSHLRSLLAHLLKWTCQPARRTRSWRLTMYNCRDEIDDIVRQSPSLDLLTSSPDASTETVAAEYQRARRAASIETGLPLDRLPETCPWTVEQILDPDFLPGAPAAGTPETETPDPDESDKEPRP